MPVGADQAASAFLCIFSFFFVDDGNKFFVTEGFYEDGDVEASFINYGWML